MCRDNSRQSHHGRHHHHGETSQNHHHDTAHKEGSPLSRRDRLIVRLQHSIRHNQDHAASYGSMVEEAQGLAAEEAARLIRSAAEHTARQNEDLQKALAALKSGPFQGRGNRA
jgi:hypothetical protein